MGVHVAAFAEAAHLSQAQVGATVLGRPTSFAGHRPSSDDRAVDALHERATLDDAEFQPLRAHYDDDQILEIILLCGFYRTVSYLANALALPLEENAARFPK